MAVICAVSYGLTARYFFGREGADKHDFEKTFAVMSVAFIYGVPFSLGFIATFVGQVRNFRRAIVFPQLPALTALGVSLLLAWEGIICIWLWLPLFALLAAVGGTFGALALRIRSSTGRNSTLGLALVLPYGGMISESRVVEPRELRVVETSIDIDAPAEVVWKEIVEVPAIKPSEHSFCWSHFMGFPRPVAATARGRGVGSIREASFERGVLFVEKVTKNVPGRELSFSIHADEGKVPTESLDEHVTVGGRYFDVLQGTYRIERKPSGVRLHLSSVHRISTRFNGYAGFWTTFVLRDTQRYILKIVARRAAARSKELP